jgi:hypothetical protein
LIKAYFLHSDCSLGGEAIITGIFFDKKLARKAMFMLGRQEYLDKRESQERWRGAENECMLGTLPPYREYLKQEFCIVERNIVETTSDLRAITKYNVGFWLETGEVSFVVKSLECRADGKRTQPHLITSEEADLRDEGIHDIVWAEGDSVEDARKRAMRKIASYKKWPDDAIKPHKSLILL